MRRLQTIEQAEKRKKRNTIIISSIMLLVLLSSTLGFAFLSNPVSHTPIDNNQPLDIPQIDRTSIQYQGQIFYLLSSQEEIEKVDISITNNIDTYNNKILYVDIDNHGILQEIGSTLGRFSSRIQPACYGSCDDNIPEKNCQDEDNLIVWENSETNRVYQEGSCVFIQGDMASADAFISHLFI